MQTITVSIVRDDDVYISHCLDYDIASEGSSKQEAIDNIKEAVSLFLEVASPKEIQSRLERRGQIEQLTI
ncbi:MAG: type II toxin-antitoxin system HicB family antitoxin [Chloroflexi bacterium]|nr:type II toxin-antitoxin system HicB family antitoxin [Chloroflexota bacterium]